MITIIKHGYMANTPPKATRYQMACNCCGCVFECNFNDFKSYVNYGELHECEIECPECGAYLKIPMHEVRVFEEFDTMEDIR